MLFAALASIDKGNLITANLDMLVLQGRQTIALVLALIFGVADADACLIQQVYGKSCDFVPS